MSAFAGTHVSMGCFDIPAIMCLSVAHSGHFEGGQTHVSPAQRSLQQNSPLSPFVFFSPFSPFSPLPLLLTPQSPSHTHAPRTQVVSEDKRQMCIFQLATNASKPWLWWEYAAGYSLECTMANGQFGSLACAERQTQRIGLDPHEVATCMGDDDSDEAHPLLQVLPLRPV